MADLQSEMLNVILKDLPNQTSGVLKTYLDEAEKIKAALARSDENHKTKNDQIISKDREIATLKEKVADLQAKIKSQDDLDQKFFSMEMRERNMELSLLNERCNSFQRENRSLMELAQTVFRSPSTKKIVETESIPLVIPPQYQGGCSHVQHENKTKTTTETVE